MHTIFSAVHQNFVVFCWYFAVMYIFMTHSMVHSVHAGRLQHPAILLILKFYLFLFPASKDGAMPLSALTVTDPVGCGPVDTTTKLVGHYAR